MTQSNNAQTVADLQPKRVWELFAGMADVPRPSKSEEHIRAHMRATAESLGFGVREDSVGNMVIEVPATKGHENAPITVLQGHVDMVCEKNADTAHDFDNDPIRLVIDKDAAGEPIVRADSTTLGADNGIGLALALAAAADPDVVHGPLEILCTIDEEMGMTGAKALASDFIKGRRLVNLDSEEDNAIYIGCAGGCDTNLTWRFPLNNLSAGNEACRVKISGLRGGHSGGDIHENRGNAIKALARTLLRSGDPLQISRIEGGSKRNAIPREASALVVGAPGIVAKLQDAAGDVQLEVAQESDEPNLSIQIETVPTSGINALLSADDSARLLNALIALPHGVLAMHRELEGLVETSNNVATITATPQGDNTLQIVVGALSRSSLMSQLHNASNQVGAVGRLAGAEIDTGNEYPGWAPNVDSPLLAVCRDVYKRTFSEDPHVMAIHAGLECGIIGERVGEIDTVSFGPRIEGAHSPEERVYIQSVEKSWKFLKAVLGELAKR